LIACAEPGGASFPSSIDGFLLEPGLPRFWQRRFYDFNVWSAKKRAEKLDYMHFNPQSRKLVNHAQQWPWSSWWYYARGETGLVEIDPVG